MLPINNDVIDEVFYLCLHFQRNLKNVHIPKYFQHFPRQNILQKQPSPFQKKFFPFNM